MGEMAKLVECNDVLVSYLPLSHVAAQVLDMYIPLLHGATVYFARPDALKVCETYFVGCGTIFISIHTIQCSRRYGKDRQKDRNIYKTPKNIC